jgi:hypothetical protein
VIRAVALAAAALVLSACVGSGKTATLDDLGTLPPGVRVVADTTMGCRDGESGFDYRFVVLEGSTDLSSGGPLQAGLRAQGFYQYVPQNDDLPWVTVGFQHAPNPDQTPYPLRVELGPLSRYLARPTARTGPDPASLPAEVRDDPERYVLAALRPSDFHCTTPL